MIMTNGMFNLENPTWVYKPGFDFSTCEILLIEEHYLSLVWNPINTKLFMFNVKSRNQTAGLANRGWVSLSWLCD
jgi:hypothetical protein